MELIDKPAGEDDDALLAVLLLFFFITPKPRVE